MIKLYLDLTDFPCTSSEYDSGGWCPFLVGWGGDDGDRLFSWVTIGEFSLPMERLRRVLEKDAQHLPDYKREKGISIEAYLSDPDEFTVLKAREVDSLAALAAEVQLANLIGQVTEIDYWWPNGTEGLERGVYV